MDGQGMQTLHCAAPGFHISNAQCSIDQKWVVFDEGPATGGASIYLLNMASGSLQTELVPPAAGLAYKPRTWLDSTRVLMIGYAPNAGAPPQNVYTLDINKGANQHLCDLQQVVTHGQSC